MESRMQGIDMSWTEYLIIALSCSATILICRVVPLFALKDRSLPDGVVRALGMIPPAAFAALVANDILDPGMFLEGIWPGAAILVASICVVAIAIATKSLLWSAIGGVVCYALLLLI